jgi:hypothetical protein
VHGGRNACSISFTYMRGHGIRSPQERLKFVRGKKARVDVREAPGAACAHGQCGCEPRCCRNGCWECQQISGSREISGAFPREQRAMNAALGATKGSSPSDQSLLHRGFLVGVIGGLSRRGF